MSDGVERADLARYHRQALLPGVGEEGQRRLAASHALIVGCGALGCAAADHLARAGVGRLTVADRDVVELTNLQRQCLFDERDAAEGLPKAEAARRRLKAVNSAVRVEAVVAHVGPGNAEALAGVGGQRPRAGVIVDGTDNYQTRLLLNDVAVKHGVPYIYAGVVGTHGMVMAVLPGRTACLRCLMDRPPAPGVMPTCDTAGVLGPAVGAVAAWESAEAIRALLGVPRAEGLLEMDLWRGTHRRLAVRADPRCACCTERKFEYLAGAGAGSAAAMCGSGGIQVLPGRAGPLDLAALAARLLPHGRFVSNGFLLRGRVEEVELTVFTDGRAIVRGVESPDRARAVYDRYVGA